jgi:ATP adenylyltransferase
MAGEAAPRRLWSPWRMAYIRAATGSGAESGGRRSRPGAGSRARGGAAGKRGESGGCLFCRLGGRRADRADLVLARRPHAFLMLNRFPYNPAHLMVAVVRHAPRFADLTPGEREDLLDLTALAERALAAEYRPHGVNYGANVGRIAGAGYPGHLHLHVVPRWSGDTNFMPTIAETKVLPESLSRTWTRLRRAVAALESAPSGAGGRTRGRRR